MTVRLFKRNGFWHIEKDRVKRSLKTQDQQVAEKLLAEIKNQDRTDIDRKAASRILGCEIKSKDITGIVYFIQAELGGNIKIGYTVDIDKRLRTVQSHSPVPVKVIGMMRGSRKIEQEVHDEFSTSRKHGEWFEPSERLFAFIAFHNEKIEGDMKSTWEELVEAANKITLAPASAITS